MADLYFFVKNNLAQEKKHRGKMGDAIWLYLYLLSYSNRSQNRDKAIFYIKTYCKLMGDDKDLVISQLMLLTHEGYIQHELVDDGAYMISIVKPIKPMVCYHVNKLSTS